MTIKRNRFYTENPSYTLFLSPQLGIGEDEGADCGIDPVTGEYTCKGRVEKTPKPVPGPDSEPFPEPGEPWPDEPSPDPQPAPEKNPVEEIGKAILYGLAQVAAGLLGGRRAYADPPRQSNYQPIYEQPYQQAAFQPIQSRASVNPPPAVSPVARNQRYQVSLAERVEEERRRIDEMVARTAPRSTRHITQSIANAYGPWQMTPVNASAHNQRPEYTTYEPPMDTAAQEAFRTLVNPPSGANAPGIQEDQRWIQENLSHAQKPVTWQDQVRMQDTAAQQQLQQQVQQAQLATAKFQKEMYEAQARLIREQQSQILQGGHQQSVSPAKQLFSAMPWFKKVQQQELLSDNELKQLFHDIELKKYSHNQSERILVQKAEPELKKLLAWNMSQGPNALKNKDGYIIIGVQAYGTKEVPQVALKDVEYFQEHDNHLPPLPYLATPDLKKQYYPDVTKKVQEILLKIAKEIEQVNALDKARLILARFPNNGDWDLQVNHGLPGQVLEQSLHNSEILKDQFGKIKTRDQYAVFKGEVHRAGYISNYAFGYGTASAGIYRSFSELLAHLAALPGRDGDNPQDIQAIKDGWNEYWHK